MGRKAQTPILGDVLQLIQFLAGIMLDHPFYTVLALTGGASLLQAIFNGNPVSAFYLTFENMVWLINFFLTDINDVCLSFIHFCLPHALVWLFNIIKILAFGAAVLKDLFPIWLMFWQTLATLVQT